MSSPLIPSGGGDTVNRKWACEVNTGTSTAPVWTALGYVNNFAPVVDSGSLQDDTGFGDGGFSSQSKTGAAWSATATVMRKIPDNSPTNYDAAQEYLRLKSIGTFGAANRVQIRFFEWDANDPNGTLSPRIEAYMGYAAVQWAEQGGAQDALSTVQITFSGSGKLSIISHPYPATPAVPNVDSVSPRNVSTAGGQQVSISGEHFTGTTGVTVGGTAVTAYTVVSDSLIVATVPAHAAGTAALVVTNGVGPSTTGGNLTYA